MTAGHRRLANLTADRRPQPPPAGRGDRGDHRPRPARRQAAAPSAGTCREVDGHDHAALLRAARPPVGGRNKPLCVIANTVKGKGVSFMENKAAWHHGVPNADAVRPGDEGTGLMAHAAPVQAGLSDCREAWVATLIALAEADPRIVAVVNDSRRLLQARRLPEALPRAAGQRRHRRADHGRRRRRPRQWRQDPLRLGRRAASSPAARSSRSRPTSPTRTSTSSSCGQSSAWPTASSAPPTTRSRTSPGCGS